MAMMRPWPYIGITGFNGQAQVRAVLDAYPQSAKHKLMVGMLTSKKAMAGLRTKFNARNVPKEQLDSIFTDHKQALNLVHYHTQSAGEELLRELLAVRKLAGAHFHGFQLNVRWPDLKAIKAYHAETFRVHSKNGFVALQQDAIVLQCGSGAIEDVGRSPKALAERVALYDGFVRYVLIDPSGGKGEPFEADFASECFREIEKLVPTLGLGIAGGLCAESIGNIRTLAREFPNFSIDAEGRLRNKDDTLNIRKSIDYTRASLQLFAEEDALV